jgi:RNA polymerase sigma factor (sigma-70 family)
MSKFNPDFWEIAIEHNQLESFANENSLWYKYNQSYPEREQREPKIRKMFQLINELIRKELTARQRQIVRLYYFEKLSEEEISQRLDISQQVISQHLFGIMRDGKRVGGAIPKLQKICKKRGIIW